LEFDFGEYRSKKRTKYLEKKGVDLEYIGDEPQDDYL
jgi:hypothetical protein